MEIQTKANIVLVGVVAGLWLFSLKKTSIFSIIMSVIFVVTLGATLFGMQNKD
jgi:hypothetical protein